MKEKISRKEVGLDRMQLGGLNKCVLDATYESLLDLSFLQCSYWTTIQL